DLGRQRDVQLPQQVAHDLGGRRRVCDDQVDVAEARVVVVVVDIDDEFRMLEQRAVRAEPVLVRAVECEEHTFLDVSRRAALDLRFFSLPSTDTNTRRSRRSGEMSTPVTVTMPMRGSFRSATASATTARTASLTRRIRSVIERYHLERCMPGEYVEVAVGVQ